MDSPAVQLMMPMSAWSVANWLAVFTMWTVMMAAMMLPSAAPMVLCFAALNRKRNEGARTLLFVAAYLALWTAFSGAAAATQWALQSIGWVSPMIVSTSSVLSAALLLIAGVFQFSRLKHACLRACRSPLGFLMSDWRDGLWGAWRYGAPPRALLSWLLLGTDGAAVRRRSHKSPLDCRSRRSRGDGKTCAEGRGGRAGIGRGYDRRGCREIGFGFAVMDLVCNARSESAPSLPLLAQGRLGA